jgi:hypothetical protein
MKDVKIIPFEEEHVDQFDDHEGELIYIGNGFVDQIRVNQSLGPAYSGVYNGQIVGCGGVRIHWDGFGQAWGIYPSSIFLHFIKEVFYYTRQGLNMIIQEHNLGRIEATARCDFYCAQNWLRHLGFEVETRMRNYCPSGKDAFLYSIIRNT